MSGSWISERTRTGGFPQPIRLGCRFTRWRASDIQAWISKSAAASAADADTRERLAARAAMGATAAKAKRLADAAQQTPAAEPQPKATKSVQPTPRLSSTQKSPKFKPAALAVLKALRSGSKTSAQLAEVGGARFSARLHELKNQGFVIEREPLSSGPRSPGRYTLTVEPVNAQQGDAA